MPRILAIVLLPILAAFMVCLIQPYADGCAAPARPGYDIHIAEESAIILWDPVKKIEHFIRSATFDTKSPDFGFLVPTPAKPILQEVENAIFTEAASWLKPRIVERYSLAYRPFLCCYGYKSKASREADMAPANKSVRILGEQDVGGFKSVILEADNTEDLSNWLKENGYSNDPELQSWLFPYVTHKWKITAFKIIQDPKTGKLAATKPVRMSFPTERPFFPYREPEQKKKAEPQAKNEKEKDKDKDKDKSANGPGGRLLRVFFVSDARMTGSLGNATWHAKVPWSDQLTATQRARIASETGVPADEIPANAWLTAFEDRASPRPGKDEVYFTPDSDQTPIRPEIIHVNEIWIPIDCALLSALLLILGIAVMVRRRSFRSALPMNRGSTR